MNERRRADRRQLMFNARVLDEASGSLLGNLSNLSSDGGLMLVSERPLVVGSEHRVRIPLPVAFEGVQELVTDTTVAWTEKAVHPDYHRNGLRADSLDATQRAALERLIREYDLDIE